MSQYILDDTALLPSELERQQIFHWLKKLSSVTAWERILQYYKAWAAVTENSLRTAEERGWEKQTALPRSEYILILKCLAHCEEGVRRLRKGDKRVFKFDANGEFAMAWRILSHWAQMISRIELGENGIDEKHTPLWAKFDETLTHVCRSWQECAQKILEPRYLEDPALTMYGRWLRKEILTMPFPDQLDKVPNPVDNIFVRTAEWIPCSGIWEPVDVPKPSGGSLINLFTRTPKPQPPYKLAGAMNYLHEGSNAPQSRVETLHDAYYLDVTWRLLWRDQRYFDGKIPEEEKYYRFTEPRKPPPQTRIVTQEKIRELAEMRGTAASDNQKQRKVDGGERCAVAGYYFTPTKVGSRRFFKKGEQVPEFQSKYGITIWQWDTDQMD